MIYLRNVSLSFLDKKLFDNINWTIHPKAASVWSAITERGKLRSFGPSWSKFIWIQA